MTRITIKMCRLFRCFLFALAAIWGVCSLQGAYWRLHPSFDNNPLRIIDSERYTYFVVHQQPFDRNADRFSTPSVTVFIADRESPDSGIVPLSRMASISPGQIRRVDYFPARRVLGISYSDGLIELVGNDMSVMRINRLVSGDLPGMSLINSLTPSPVSDDIFAATDAGWLKIDSRTGETGEFVYSGIKMLAVTHIGGKILALADDAVLQRNPQTQPSALAPIEGILSPSLLLPVNASSFAYISDNGGSAPALMLATMKNGEWNLRELCRDYFVSRPGYSSVTSPYEGNAVPNRDGYLLYSYSTMWQLRTAGEDGEPSVDSAPACADFSGVGGSWDFSGFWWYKDRGTFISRKLDNSGGVYQWGEASAPMRPDAPVAYIARHMDYSERHGLLLMNMQPFHTGTYYIRTLPPLVSGRLNGKWMNYSPAYTEPSAITGNDELTQTYHTYRSWFPHADPAGITIDPLYPDYIWSGSIWGGMMMADVSDPSASHRRFGAENDLLSGFPGFHAIIPTQGWDTFSCISPVKPDTDGNLWALLFDYKGQKEGSSTSSLLCFTKERRKAMMDDDYPGTTWEVIPLPDYKSHTMFPMLLPLVHQERAAHILAHPSSCDGSIFFIDHGGTPCQKEDDKMFEASVFRFPEGSERTLGFLMDFAEDPATGRVVVATDNGVFVIEPGTLPDNGVLEVSHLCLSGDGGEEIIPPVTHVNRILFDPYGRLWLGTANEGVVGVSKGFREVVARFNRDNSPLPSDMVYGLGWNEAENSLLISTEGGLAEVVPGNEGVWVSGGGVSIYPHSASPEYNGMVTISNLPPDSMVEITGPDGKRAALLYNRHSTRVEWSVAGSDGKRVEGGLYTIRVSDGSEFLFPVLSGL